MAQQFIAQPLNSSKQMVTAGILLIDKGWYDISAPNRNIKYIYYPGEEAKKHPHYKKAKTQVDNNLSFIYSVIKEKLLSLSAPSSNKQPIMIESNKTSPAVDFSSFDANKLSKMADISVIYKGVEFKEGGTHYRKDGSILYTIEHQAYKRIWDMSLLTKNEEAAVISLNKVLVEPSYYNEPTKALFREYGYKYGNGDYVDCITSSKFTTIATVHTHPQGEVPSRWNPIGGYGDLGFGSQSTPLKPVYVLRMHNVNKIAFLYTENFRDDRKFKNYLVLDIKETYPSASILNLFSGKFSLIDYTVLYKNAFKEHLKNIEFIDFKN